MKNLRSIFLLLCVLFSLSKSSAQSLDGISGISINTTGDSLSSDELNKKFQNQVLSHFNQYKQHRIENFQRKKISELEQFEEKLSNYLKLEHDTSDIIMKLVTLEEGYYSALDGISTTNGSMVSVRDITA
ncbi:MAG: hypothetical protein RL135_1320, partial [Bacteroidota bacterium]